MKKRSQDSSEELRAAASSRREHWRAGIDGPIALLRPEPEELAARCGLVFEEDHDDLDRLEQARLVTDAGRVYALVRHQQSPSPGTEVVTATDSLDLRGDLAQVLAALGLDEDDVIWRHPGIELASRPGRFAEDGGMDDGGPH